MIRATKPDIIAITGDLIDSRNTDIDVALKFAKEAVEIATCYYVTGNYEARLNEYGDFKSSLTELGVIVLDDQTIELKKTVRRLR